MNIIKSDVIEMIRSLPDDCTYEDIQYHLYVRQRIQEGFEEVERGLFISHEAAREHMRKCLTKLAVGGVTRTDHAW